tara:strand:- start:152 stop:367 length:216 start_codon:yes stop_codon:yes gene_type:complete
MNPECINCCNKEEKEKYREIVDTQHELIEHLDECIQRIASLIYYQDKLKHQDLWLRDMIEQGLYTPDEEFE